jgi:hypothetical protein
MTNINYSNKTIVTNYSNKLYITLTLYYGFAAEGEEIDEV